MRTTEMKMLRWIQGKTRKDIIRNESSGEMQWLSQLPHVTQKGLSWYGHVLRREDTNVAKQVTIMKVGGKRHRGRPTLRWMDRVQSDMKQHKLDEDLAHDREAWKKAIMAIDEDRDRIGKEVYHLNVGE